MKYGRFLRTPETFLAHTRDAEMLVAAEERN